MLIDFLFGVMMVFAIIKGYSKGLILALFSIIAFIIGLAAALKLSAVVAAYFSDSVHVSTRWLPFIAFILIFLAVILLVRLGAKLIEKVFQVAMLGWLNRLGGIVFYMALYIIILSIFLFYAITLQVLKPEAIASSLTYEFIQPWGPKVMDNIGKVIPVFKDMFTALGDFFNSATNKIPL